MKIEEHPVNISTVARFWGLDPHYLYCCYRNFISDYKRDIKSGKWANRKPVKVDTATGEIIEEVKDKKKPAGLAVKSGESEAIMTDHVDIFVEEIKEENPDYVANPEKVGECSPLKSDHVCSTILEIKESQLVYIAKPENMGTIMTIDDKHLGKSVFTIMTNAETKKIAFMAETVKKDDLKKFFETHFGTTLNSIGTISSDMSTCYINLCRETMMNADVVVDKFHVTKYVCDAVQDEKRKAKRKEMRKLTDSKKKRKKHERASSETKAREKTILQNIDLLRRSTYLLNRSESDWDAGQRKTMEEVFNKFKGIRIAYKLKEDFRQWYDRKNIISNIEGFEKCGKEEKIEKAIKRRKELTEELENWHMRVEKTNSKEMKAASSMIMTHQELIINYFMSGASNALAENMNGRLQRFVTNNYGMKDKDFTLYRIAQYFS